MSFNWTVPLKTPTASRLIRIRSRENQWTVRSWVPVASCLSVCLSLVSAPKQLLINTQQWLWRDAPLILNSDWVGAIRFAAMSDSCLPEWEGDGEEAELERNGRCGRDEKEKGKGRWAKKSKVWWQKKRTKAEKERKMNKDSTDVQKGRKAEDGTGSEKDRNETCTKKKTGCLKLPVWH